MLFTVCQLPLVWNRLTCASAVGQLAETGKSR
jgi:hypothetical protein